MTSEEQAAVDAKNEELLRAYQLTFNGTSGQIVLTDLVKFCRAADSSVVEGDPYMTHVMEGRRDVFLRIQRHARLSYDEILQLRLGRINPKVGGAA